MTSTRLEPDDAPADESRALRTETRLGMIIEWDVPIRTSDGVVLRADIFRPAKEGRFPVLMSHGPY
jgi:predicted acyl esterase